MTILLAQLRYQDPMAPMQEKDFFGQMAQFTSATSIGEMNKKMDLLVQSFSQSQVSQNLLAASNLIGKAFTAVTDYGLLDGIVGRRCSPGWQGSREVRQLAGAD
jgi:flagellar basal-body rod modification protein FlgD